MDDIDNTTQQQDMCTATNRIDATYTGVKEKCTSTLQPEKDNGFALLERLLQIRKRDSAVIPLEEKNPDPKRPIKAKLEISHTPRKYSTIMQLKYGYEGYRQFPLPRAQNNHTLNVLL